MRANKTNGEFRQLLADLVDGRLDKPGLCRFETLLSESPERQKFYDEFMTLHAMLLWRAGPPICNTEASDADPFAIIIDTADAPQAFTSGELGGVWRRAVGFIGGREFAVPYIVATLVIGFAILFGSMLHITHHEWFVGRDPSRPIPGTPDNGGPRFVGFITGMKECRWSDADESAIIGARVALKRRFSISSGLLEITYDSGARVILEGPCEYTADSREGGYLRIGKLVARVEKRRERRGERGEKADGLVASATSAKAQAANPEPRTPSPESPAPSPQSPLSTHHSPLFTISTPTAVITDLGTEFGVEVDENGDTASHVFRGSIAVQVAGGGKHEKVILCVRESVRVEKGKRNAKPQLITDSKTGDSLQFVRRLRELPKSLDLLDIVAGGNGLGNKRERGIDPAVGLADPIFLATIREGNRHYNPVTWHRFIDGVFIPDGRNESMRIDSADHTFDGFPTTSGNGYGSIWSRGPDIKPEWAGMEKTPWFYSMGRAGQFMPENQGLLCFCPNAGITFDLEAMRLAYPDTAPSRFRAVAGLVDSRHLVPTADGMADLWIFVDGHLKLKREKLRPESGTVAVDIELGPGDRFLTLASTDGGNGYENDYVVFGDPVFELGPAEEDK